MKKESDITLSPKRGILFKICTIMTMLIALVLIYVEYIGYKIGSHVKPESDTAHIMKVHIETGDNNQHNEELDNLEKELSDKISSDTIEALGIKASIEAKADNYRLYLAHIMRLVEKFSQHEDYLEEIEFLHKNKDSYNSDISIIITLLENYRKKYLTSDDAEYKKLSLEGGFVKSMVNKIIHIEQKNPEHKTRIEEYNMLKSKLHIIEGYFYSKEFLKKYLSND